MMGFNPKEYARRSTIELWRDRKNGVNKSVYDVVHRLARMEEREKEEAGGGEQREQRARLVLMNPIVGPEPICASSSKKC